MKFSLLSASIFVQAVLHKEFVGAKSDKLLGGLGSDKLLMVRCVIASGMLAAH